MNDTLTTPQSPEVVLTPEIVKSKLQIALTKAEQSIQALHNAESELVYNEDNLELIKRFVDSCKAAEKVVDEERIKMKEPYLKGGRAVDDGAKLVSNELNAIKVKANEEYQRICRDVERRRQEAEREQQRVAGIRSAMDEFKIAYSVKIADAKTSKELVDIERRINLETANKTKYQEFLPEFVEDCKAIRSLLTGQKEKVREIEELERQANLAAQNGSDEQILEIMEKKEALESEIAETRINVQETASQQATKPTETATVIIPMIPKGGRRLCKWVLVDEKAATKKGWTTVVPNKELIDKYLDENRDKILDETGFVEGGVKFFVEKRF